MNRLPSIGFVYLLATVVAFALGCWWLIQPHWYEQQEPESSRSRVAYLFDLANASEEPERTARLRTGLDQGFQVGATTGNWQLLRAMLEAMQSQPTRLSGVSSMRVGDAWLVTKNAPASTGAGTELVILACNSQPEPRDMELLWTGDDALAVSIEPQGGAATQLSFHDGKARLVLENLAPGAPSMFTVRSTQLQNLELVEARLL